jgi:hypothetical protein
MRKKHVSETAPSRSVWLCDESYSHSGDGIITRIPEEKWIENRYSVRLADDTLKQATREREREREKEKIWRETTTTTGGESAARERFGIS